MRIPPPIGLITLILLAPACVGATDDPEAALHRANPASSAPPGWLARGRAAANYVVEPDTQTHHHGKRSVSLRSTEEASPDLFGNVMQVIKADDFRGKRIAFAMDLKTENAAQGASPFMRLDAGNSEVLVFASMNDAPIAGTSDWKRYRLVMDVPQESAALSIGIDLEGTGRVWMDDVRVEVVGANVDVSAAPLTPEQRDKNRALIETFKQEHLDVYESEIRGYRDRVAKAPRQVVNPDFED